MYSLCSVQYDPSHTVILKARQPHDSSDPSTGKTPALCFSFLLPGQFDRNRTSDIIPLCPLACCTSLLLTVLLQSSTWKQVVTSSGWTSCSTPCQATGRRAYILPNFWPVDLYPAHFYTSTKRIALFPTIPGAASSIGHSLLSGILQLAESSTSSLSCRR